MSKQKIELAANARIGIIGGGPAGSFFAVQALKLALQKKLNINLTIFDEKRFTAPGPKSCNMCAGVISDHLIKYLANDGIVIPAGRVQRKIDGYYFHTRSRSIYLKTSYDEAIFTVFRGNGPVKSDAEGNVSFDGFLLETAQKRGATVIDAQILDIQLPDKPESPVKCVTKDGQTYSFDLLVAACGLNTALLEKFQNLGFGYKPPVILRTFQTEAHLGREYIEKHFGNNVHTFVLGLGKIDFVAMVPKRDYITISVVGSGHMTHEDLKKFLEHKKVRKMFPDTFQEESFECSCAPKIAFCSARNPAVDRFVMIGDTSYSRYYKNGIESAFITAQLAAQAAFNTGVDAASFKKAYFAQANKIIVKDNRYGRVFFRLNKWVSKSSLLTKALMDLTRSEHLTYTARILRQVLWIMFTGKEPYKKAFIYTLNPFLQIMVLIYIIKTMLSMAGSALFAFLRFIIKPLLGASPAVAGENPPSDVLEKITGISGLPETLGPLHDNQTVVIIGGGPAGTSCAINLKRLAQRRGLNIKVIIYESKVFQGKPQYNQCVGVLSPPIANILEEELEVPFPHHLVQREINTYVLHSDNRQINLVSENEISYAVRRVNFDNYMMEEALKRGVEVIKSRVTNVEFGRDKVMVYSETDNRVADVVVGAFGSDAGTAQAFESVTGYRQPQFLNSIVTKVYTDEKFMKDFGNYIHAFLPSMRKIEFGGITPKRNHLTINIAGEDVSFEWMDKFLRYPPVRKLLPPDFKVEDQEHSFHKGRFPVHPARNLFGDRYIMIGDASGLIRPFKGKGVNAACLGGLEAARIMIEQGISKSAFKIYLRSFDNVTQDILYGKLLRWLAIQSANTGVLDGVIDLAGREEVLRRALFNCVSAHKPFKKIMAETAGFNILMKLARTTLTSYFLRGKPDE